MEDRRLTVHWRGTGAALAAAYVLALAFQRPVAFAFGFEIVPADLVAIPLALAAMGLAMADRRRFASVVRDPFAVAIGLYGCALLASLPGSADPAHSALKLLTQLYLLGLPLALAMLVRDRAAVQWTCLAALAGGATVGLLAVIALSLWAVQPEHALVRALAIHFGSLPPGPYVRLSLSFTTPALMAFHMALLLPLAVMAASQRWVSNTTAATLIAVMALAALSGITPQIVGLVTAAAWMLWLSPRAKPLRAVALVIGVIAVVTMQAAVSVLPTGQPGEAPLLTLPDGTALYRGVRPHMWTDSFEAWRSRPWFGYGIGIDPAQVDFLAPSGTRHFLTDAHNQYLSLLAQTGLVGLAAFLGLCAVIALSLRSSGIERALAVSLLTGALVQGLTGSFEDNRGWWALLGLSLAVRQSRHSASWAPSAGSSTASRSQSTASQQSGRPPSP